MNQGLRFVLAVVLMVGVIIVTNMLFPPVPRSTTQPADTIATPSAPAPAQETAPAGAAPAPTTAEPAATPMTADTVVVESPLYRFAFSSQGAALVSAEMLKFQSFKRDGPVQLAGRTPGGLLNHNLRIGDRIVVLSALPFRASEKYVRLTEDGGARQVRFTHESAEHGVVEITYDFVPDDYLVHVTLRANRTPAVESVQLRFGPTLAFNEANNAEDQRALAYVVNSRREGIESRPLRSVNQQHIEEGPLDWVALKNKYFVFAAVIDTADNAQPFGGLIADDHPARYAARLTATLPVQQNGTIAYRLYAGPQEYERLVAVGNQLHDVNPVGWRVFRPILRPLAQLITWCLITIHRLVGISYGWVLIIFGVLVRVLIWPLNAKAMRSQLKTMELQPKIKELQTRYKDNPQKLQQEMMKLYREEGFNPLGGCLPMLLPMPVLITLFFVFQNFIEFRGVPFLWLPDLSRADPYYILPIILGATIFVQQLISMKTMPPNPQMKFMLYFMPAFLMIIFWRLASGLNLYYAAQNIPGFVQQLRFTKERQRYMEERGIKPESLAPSFAPPAKPAPKSPAPQGKKPRKR